MRPIFRPFTSDILLWVAALACVVTILFILS
jgi:hypothetical protein